MRPALPMLIASALLVVAPPDAMAQPPRQGRQRGPMGPVRSPEVAKDGRVTFRLRAPNAQQVAVSRDGVPRAAMKDEQGVWRLTTDPLPPDIYPYTFNVDGPTIADPANPPA